MDGASSQPQPRKRLIEGHRMVCPRCEVSRDILDYTRMGVAAGYEDETTPVYKCPRNRGGCGFVFAPAERALASFLGVEA